jgi:hypothetical protein
MLGQLQRARRRVLTRIRDYKAILGDATNQVYADPGYYWVRPFSSADDNSNSTPGVPYQVRSGTALVVPRGGRQVWVGIGLDGHLTVKGFVHEDLVSTDVSIDPRSLQPNDPYRAWIRLKQIQNFRALPLATGSTASMKVQVRQLFYYTETGDLVRYNGTNDVTHIDLSSYIPAVGLQRYVVLWLRTYNPNGLDTIQVTSSSTISSLNDVLSFDELQECADNADADTVPIQAFRLHDAQTTLTMDDTIDVDLRQFINMPQVYGFPNNVSRQYRVHENHSVIMPDVVTITSGGGIQIQSGGVLVIEDTAPAVGGQGGIGTVTSVSATATPTSVFDIAVTNPTTTPDIALSMDNQSANIVLAGPASGGAATPAFRSLLDADIPNVLTLTEIDDTNGNKQIKFVTTASAVNELTITNAATNTNPKIEPTGSDANIGIDIIPKGTDPLNLDGAVVINESGADRDFRVESDGNANMLVVDASADSIGIGTNTPSSKTMLHVVSTTRASVPAPDMSTTQRDAIAAPFAGMIVYVNDQADFSWYNANELDWSNFYIPRYSQFQHPFWEHTVVSGNNPIWVSDTTQSGAGYWRQSAAALNDELSYSVALPAGTYHVEAMTTKGGGSGIMTIKWNGNTVSTHDLYNATAVVNFRVVSSSFNVLIPGVYAFGIKAASKNAASSGYLLSVSWYQFIRTANYP